MTQPISHKEVTAHIYNVLAAHVQKFGDIVQASFRDNIPYLQPNTHEKVWCISLDRYESAPADFTGTVEYVNEHLMSFLPKYITSRLNSVFFFPAYLDGDTLLVTVVEVPFEGETDV